VATPVQSDVYYQGIYWNSYDDVVRHLNERAYGSPEGTWYDFVRNEHGGAYGRGLSLNCGTGWVERDLVAAGAVSRLVALDYLDDLLDIARQASQGLPIDFERGDVNEADFPDGPFDLVVNHAAGHHITYVDRVFRRLRGLVAPGGSLVTWDYTGPHRNQYTPPMWSAAAEVNERLPAHYRSTMDYPHLPTMLATDPTEAIHSELIGEVMSRYFRHRRHRRLGGPIAYLLLTHNQQLYEAPEDQRDDLVRMIIDADAAHVEEFPEDNLFTFAISTPRSEDELDPDLLEAWTMQEELREAAAIDTGGRYYLPTAIETAREMNEAPARRDHRLIAESRRRDAVRRAYRGPRFVAAAFVRSIAIRFPATLPPLRTVRRVLRRGSATPTG
jgi:SAM-dependent methyltransferase